MAETIDSLTRQLAELQREVKELKSLFAKKTELGTAGVPIRKIFLTDLRTGAVAELDYDSEAGAARLTRVR